MKLKCLFRHDWKIVSRTGQKPKTDGRLKLGPDDFTPCDFATADYFKVTRECQRPGCGATKTEIE